MCVATSSDGVTKWVKDSNKSAWEQSTEISRGLMLGTMSEESAKLHAHTGDVLKTDRQREANEKAVHRRSIAQQRKNSTGAGPGVRPSYPRSTSPRSPRAKKGGSASSLFGKSKASSK